MEIICLGGAVASVLTAFALLRRSSKNRLRSTDAEEPQYVTDARRSVESLEIQYSVAAELHQAPATVEELGRRLDAARIVLKNALAAARQTAKSASRQNSAKPGGGSLVPVRQAPWPITASGGFLQPLEAQPSGRITKTNQLVVAKMEFFTLILR